MNHHVSNLLHESLWGHGHTYRPSTHRFSQDLSTSTGVHWWAWGLLNWDRNAGRRAALGVQVNEWTQSTGSLCYTQRVVGSPQDKQRKLQEWNTWRKVDKASKNPDFWENSALFCSHFIREGLKQCWYVDGLSFFFK